MGAADRYLTRPAVVTCRIAMVATVLAALLTLGALVLDRSFPPELSSLDVNGGEILDRGGRLIAMRPAPGGVWRLRARVEDVSPAFLDRLLATEDRRFWRHPGVDPLALARALMQDVRAGHVVSGGSTLTMQAVRLLHPRPRTLRSKLIETARALQLEAHYSKRDILGIWLTLAPFGGNVEGVRAAARAWYGVDAAALDQAQAAFLVALPRRPEALRPDRLRTGNRDRVTRLRNRLLAGAWTGPLPPVPDRRQPIPRIIPVLAGLPLAERLTTTLDGPLQASLTSLLRDVVGGLPDHASACVLIAELGSRRIRALVSGGDPGSGSGEGRAAALDLTRAVRSPGSALKPVIYGLAFQDGLAGPETILDDGPRHFGGYAPEDFDRGFAGRITAAEALRRSLNVPAVALLDRVGPLRMAALMRASGVPLRLPPGADASLPLALGGAGITARELGSLYAGLGEDGAPSPLLLLPGAPVRHALLTPQAARLVAQVLTQRLPDGGPEGLAWKTGTSWGGRDAWAAAFDRRWVMVAWVGRPDGTPLPGATGRALALPLLARVYGLLPADPRPAPPAFVPVSVGVARDRNTATSLRLLFPPPGAELLSGDGPIVVRAMGGRRPLNFLIDGAPLAADPARREAAWMPAGPGFYRVTVLDADGAAASGAVRVR